MARVGEAVIRGIIRNIVSTCHDEEYHISQNLAGALIKAAVIHPDNGFAADKTLSEKDIDNIVEICCNHIRSQSIGVQLLRLQTEFTAQYRSRDQVREDRKRDLKDVTDEIDEDILNVRIGSRDDLEDLYRNIVSSILLNSQLGSPTDLIVVKETTAALESVLPPEDLGTFIALPRQDKRQQLKELALIVMGIRLFSMATGKGGKNIPDTIQDARQLLQSHLDRLKSTHDEVLEKANQFSSLILKSESETQLEPARGYCFYARQLVFVSQVLLGDVAESGSRLGKALASYRQCQAAVKATVESREAVPTDQVFPQFVKLGECWKLIQDEEHLLKAYTQIIELMEEYKGCLLTLPPELKAELGEVQPAVSEAGARQQWSCHRVVQVAQATAANASVAEASSQPEHAQEHVRLAELKAAEDHIELLSHAATHDFDNLTLELGGFCIASLANDGCIVPVNRYLGLVRRGNQIYGFNTREGLIEFTSKPEAMVSSVLDQARRYLGLLDLARLHTAFASLQSVKQAHAGMQATLAVKCDAGMQTELHPIESNVSKQYEWNEWELRRKALKLADLRSKKTHSTQTHLSHYRRENNTQVYLPKAKPTQTRKDGYSNTSKPVSYVRGLRGARGPKAAPVEVVDLTLQVGGFAMEPTSRK